jgi:transketolase
LNKSEIDKLNRISKKLRINIIKAALEAGSSSAHVGGALSFVDIVTILFFKIFDQKNFNMKSEARDRFILSKGHGCLGLYSALLEKKFISKKEFKTFEKNGSKILGHPVINKKLGIEFSNGSLGMGLSLGLGVAIALKKKKLKNHVYVLIGDGECNEGSVWEAVISSPKFKLNNLTAIIDKNNFQQTGSTKEIMPINSLKNSWKNFGWQVYDINGHNFEELNNVFLSKTEKPKLVIANTIKGKGFSIMENNNDWHHKILTKNTFKEIIKEIN